MKNIFHNIARFFSRMAYPLRILLAVVLMGVLFLFIDPKTVLSEIGKVSPLPYIVVILGHFVLMAIKALRWQQIMHKWNIHCTYLDCLQGYVASFALGTFTPGQIGDISKVMFVRNEAGSRRTAIATWVADRSWDLFGLVVASVACALFLFATAIDPGQILLYSIALLVLGGIGILLIWYFLRKFVLTDPEVRIHAMFAGWQWGLSLTALSVLIQFLRWGLLAADMGLPVIRATACAMIGTVIALIPVSLGGLGTREGSMAAMFGYVGLDQSAGVAYSLLMFGTYIAGAVVGAIVLLIYLRRDAK